MNTYMYRIFDAKNSEKVSKSSIHGITLTS